MQARHLSSLPALTRLCATPQAGDVAKAELRDFQGKSFAQTAIEQVLWVSKVTFNVKSCSAQT